MYLGFGTFQGSRGLASPWTDHFWLTSTWVLWISETRVTGWIFGANLPPIYHPVPPLDGWTNLHLLQGERLGGIKANHDCNSGVGTLGFSRLV